MNLFSVTRKALSRLPAFAGVGTTLFIASLVLLVSCKKESDIGADVQPEGDLIDLRASDSTFLRTYTVREDSVRSDEANIVQIGSYHDTRFGRTAAGLFTQVLIPGDFTQISFGQLPVIDSVCLQLAYDYDFYGDTGATQTFTVYQMTENLYKDSAYYSNRKKQYYSAPLGSKSFAPRPRTERLNDQGDTVPAFLRISLDNNFGQLILSNTSYLTDNTTFTDWMKGLYIAPDSGVNGALLRFLPKDSLTRLKLYYHNAANDSLTFSFVINSSAAYYSHFTHNYSSAFFSSPIGSYDPSGTEVYLQSAAGLKTKIEFPFLNDWKNLGYKIAINKAELVIKADPSDSATFPMNKQLYLVSIDSNGVQYLLPDMFENSVYYGGDLHTSSNEYHINLARYFQRLVDGTAENNGLYLKEISAVEMGRRVVLGSGNPNSPNRMYLHLVYTRIN